MQPAIRRLDLGGRDLTSYLQTLLHEKGHDFVTTGKLLYYERDDFNPILNPPFLYSSSENAENFSPLSSNKKFTLLVFHILFSLTNNSERESHRNKWLKPSI